MRVNTIRLNILLLASGLLLGCSDEIEKPPEKNHPPIVTQQSDTSAIVGDTLWLQFSAADQDGDDLGFKAQVPCNWGEISTGSCNPPVAHVNFLTGRFWFYPRASDVPERVVEVLVTDEHGEYDYMDFDVSVSTRQKAR
jgi:hypothetical protein